MTKEKRYTLREAVKMTGISISAWSQAIQHGTVKSVLRAATDYKWNNKTMPRHYVTLEEINKFEEYIKSGKNVPSLTFTGEKKRKYTVTDEDHISKQARLTAEMLREAKELGMTIDEYKMVI